MKPNTNKIYKYNKKNTTYNKKLKPKTRTTHNSMI